MLYPYNIILLNYQEKLTTNKHNNMDKSETWIKHG